MDISKTQDKINQHLNELKLYVQELNEIDTDIKKLTSLIKVEILAYPSDKLFRLRDERLSGGWNRDSIIQSESDLDKTLNDFVEDVNLENVSFEEHFYTEKQETRFKVIYKTGGYYAHKNKYCNDDFGKYIFKSRSELIEIATPIFEKQKTDFINKMKEDKEAKKEALKRELEKMNTEETNQ